jgi:hypothetical protein
MLIETLGVPRWWCWRMEGLFPVVVFFAAAAVVGFVDAPLGGMAKEIDQLFQENVLGRRSPL